MNKLTARDHLMLISQYLSAGPGSDDDFYPLCPFKVGPVDHTEYVQMENNPGLPRGVRRLLCCILLWILADLMLWLFGIFGATCPGVSPSQSPLELI